VTDNSVNSIKSSLFVENEHNHRRASKAPTQKEDAIGAFFNETKAIPSSPKGRWKTTVKSKQSITLLNAYSDKAKTPQKLQTKPQPKRHSIKPSTRWAKIPFSPPKTTAKDKWKKPNQVNDNVINIDGILNKQIYLQELGKHILKGGDPKSFQEKYNIRDHNPPSTSSNNSHDFRLKRLQQDDSSVGSSSYQTTTSNFTLTSTLRSYGSKPVSSLQKSSVNSNQPPSSGKSGPQNSLELKVMKLLNPVTSDGSLDNLAQKIRASYQFNITGKNNKGNWYIDFKGGSGVFGAGKLPAPDVTFTMTYDLAMKILERKVKVGPQIMRGNIKIQGDKRKVIKLEQFLKKLDAHQKKQPTTVTL